MAFPVSARRFELLVPLLLLVLVGSKTCFADSQPATLAIGAAAPDFSLPGVDGQDHKLADYADAKILVLVFTCNHCPTAQAYEERIKAIADDYKDKGVQLVAISPNDPLAVRLDELGYTDLDDTFDEMKIRAKDHHFNFPYLYDGETQSVSQAYGPVATPHVFVFDGERKLRFCGRIDDRENPAEAKTHETRDAIDALLAGKPVPVETTRTFGCSIKWADKRASAAAALAKWDQEPVKLEPIDAAGVHDLAANATDKLRVINVWSTTCGPCLIEFPELVKMHRMYRQRALADKTQVEVVTISTDPPEKRDNALKFLALQHASTTNYIFADGDLDKLAEALHPDWSGAMPLTIVVRPGGEVVSHETGEMDALAVRRTIVDEISRYFFQVPKAKVSTEVKDEAPKPDAEGYYSLFDGKTLAGWKVAETPGSVKVEGGEIVCGGGPRAHAFYEGPVADHDFKNFELKLQFKTQKGSNSGVYFHTEYQETDWPAKGHEAQVNNSFDADPRRTGSLYAVKDVLETPFHDDEWNDYDVKVEGRHVTLTVNGKTMVDYTEPVPPPVIDNRPGRKLSHGTIALQAHDPGSLVRYRNIRIKPLP